jgi:hypothetical protein
LICKSFAFADQSSSKALLLKALLLKALWMCSRSFPFLFPKEKGSGRLRLPFSEGKRKRSEVKHTTSTKLFKSFAFESFDLQKQSFCR